MKKPTEKAAEPAMRAEYDFSPGVRGKHARRYAQGANVVMSKGRRTQVGTSRRRGKVLAGK
jgi:hypothetical protein